MKNKKILLAVLSLAILGVCVFFFLPNGRGESITESQANKELYDIYISRDITIPEKISLIDSIASKQQSEEITSRVLLYKAKIFEYANEMDSSISLLIESTSHFSSLSKEDSILFYSTLSNNLLKLDLIGDKISFAKTKLTNWKNRKPTSLFDKYYILDELATAYIQNEDFLNAEYYYKEAQKIANSLEDKLPKLHNFNNLGYLYLKQKNYSAADSIFERGLQFYNSINAPDLLASELSFHIRYNQIRTIIFQGKWELAEQLIQQLPKKKLFQDQNIVFSREFLQFILAIRKNDTPKIIKELSSVMDIVESKEDSVELLNYLVQIHFPKEKSYNQNWSELTTKLIPEHKKTHAIELNQLFESLVKSNSLLNEEKLKNKNLQRNNMIAVLTLVFLVLGYIFLRRYSKQKQKLKETKDNLTIQSLQVKKNELELQLSKQKQNELENHLEHRKKDLEELAAEITLRKDYFNKVEERLDEIENKSNKPLIREIKMSLNQFLGFNSRHKLIHGDEGSHNEFQTKLTELGKGLSETELIICSYFRIGLEAKEIAALRNVSYHTIKAQRQEVRKKLGLDGSVKLTAFLREL